VCEGDSLCRDSGLSGSSMVLRVPLLAQALTSLLGTPGACMQVINNCRDLKATVEGATSRGHGAVDLTLQLRGYRQYHCEESVRIAASQSVKVIGDDGSAVDGSAVNVYVALKPAGFTESPAPGASSGWGIENDGRMEEGLTKSLFVNEGTLSLENIRFHLNGAQEEMYEVPGGEGKRTLLGKHRCIGSARLVRNSGHLIMQNSSVVDTPSVYSGGRPPPNCRWNENALQGRVVYSDGNNRSTVMVSRSSFDLTFPREVGEGSAFYTMGGAVGIEKSWFRTMASHPHKNTPHETADRGSTATVGLTVSVSRGCSVDSDAALTGRGVGVTGQRDGAVVFEERKGIRGEFLLVKTDCSFLGRDTNVDDDNASVPRSSSGVGMSSADLRPRGHRQLTMCTPCDCTNLFWLLVAVSMVLITLMGLFCLSRRHPDGRRRWALRWCGSAADRRVHQEAVRDDIFDSGMGCFSDDSLVEEETVTVPIGKKVTSARIYRYGSRELPTSPLQVQPTLPMISGSTSRGDGATVPADRRCQPDTLLCDGERQVQVAAGNTANGVAVDGRDARSLSPRTASRRSPSRGGACPVDHGLGESASSTRWPDQIPKEPDDDMCYSPDNEIEGEFFAVIGHQTRGLALVSPRSPHGEKPNRLAAAFSSAGSLVAEAAAEEYAAVTARKMASTNANGGHRAAASPLSHSAGTSPRLGSQEDEVCCSASSTESGTGRDSFSSAGSPVFEAAAEEYAAVTAKKMASTNANGGHRAAASPLSCSAGISPGLGGHEDEMCYSASSTESGTGRHSFSSAGSPVFMSVAEEYAAAAAAAREIASTNTNGGRRAAASPLSCSAVISPGLGGQEDEMCYSASSTESGEASGGFSSRGSPVASTAVEGHAALAERKGAGIMSSISSRDQRSSDHIPRDAHVV
ncbi:unnamed protein product, partial [Ectocarpus sp. 8 AP-2014]